MAKLRKDVNALSDDELKDYVHALDVLRKRSADNPDDPSGMDFQAALHNDVLVGPCEHGSDKFMPWHRAHLHYFEQLLQAADPPRTESVTIPYWDWIHEQADGNFPPAFAGPGLAWPGRDEDPTPLPPDTLEIVTTETDQKLFAGYPEDDPNGDYGRLEFGPHNYMHGNFIGGKMSNPGTAAEDAIYFSFHCFIDLMWAEWQRRNANPPLTSPDEDMREGSSTSLCTRPAISATPWTSTTSTSTTPRSRRRLTLRCPMSIPRSCSRPSRSSGRSPTYAPSFARTSCSSSGSPPCRRSASACSCAFRI